MQRKHIQGDDATDPWMTRQSILLEPDFPSNNYRLTSLPAYQAKSVGLGVFFFFRQTVSQKAHSNWQLRKLFARMSGRRIAGIRPGAVAQSTAATSKRIATPMSTIRKDRAWPMLGVENKKRRAYLWWTGVSHLSTMLYKKSGSSGCDKLVVR